MKSIKSNSKVIHYFLLILLICLLSKNKCKKTNIYGNYLWTNEIRNDHPRLFFNMDSFQEIKKRALNEELKSFRKMKKRVDLLLGQKIKFNDQLVLDGSQNSDHIYGTRAAESAFIYLVLEDKKYLDLTKKILATLTDYYNLRNILNLNIAWHAFSRINALAAYDWIYNHLTEKERIDIGYSLLHAINFMISPSHLRASIFRRNNGDFQTGFYGPKSLSWYAGVVFYKKGIDDKLAEELLLKGYDDNIALLQYRSNIAGDVGGAASASLNYSMGYYPWAEFNFFHTFNAATGLDISKEWPHVPYFLHYIFWNWLPEDKEYGYGDVYHTTNDLPLGSMHIHLSQIIHFYGETHQEIISLAKWMLMKIEKKQEEVIPFIRFLLTKTYDELKPHGPPKHIRLARHFDNMGQVFMRSGSGLDDTYALFTAGGLIESHRHYDNNNFIIFKKGFLALDSGTRPEPGLHLPFYFARTVAHNCITIKMPYEKMPRYWGAPSLNELPEPPHPNDGGQNNIMGSKVIAFSENDYYVYIASDATKSYHKGKADLVLRQFVFLPPDHFVIFDRITSKKPEYKKRWLLHTARKPIVTNNKFITDHLGGRLFGKTLFPKNAKLIIIGGPGKQFWSDGRNWSLPVLTSSDWNYKNRNKIPPDTLDLLGQWRIEVSPELANNEDIFLHLIQVGDTALKAMSDSISLEADDMVGVRFNHNNKEYEVMFSTKGKASGKISIFENNQKILVEEFSTKVKQQKGLF